jgi:uncharacterized metal-binding protein YceD (DUF177 family)
MAELTDTFAHELRIDQIRDGERLNLVADDDERSAVARRLGLDAIERLEAHVTLARSGKVVRASGRLAAALGQTCVVTGERLPAHVDEAFDLVFMPEPDVTEPEEEIELGQSDCDTVFHDGSAIDLGGAIADTLALSLDSYPRSASAESALKEAGILSESESSPFAALAQLKKDLEGS